ncbi:MAG: hydroxymethylbilane synthase [Deltaproteobacteria bacterium RIFCSPLOWO2_12_FULL_60_19]|nr:MAG: hydroxymethylbilane synthase [Deltaproteobacteria bacterium RIFCSPLOWO2_12_FULL_60_19]
MNVIRIGSRGSALALAQANWVKRRLEERYPGRRVEIVTIKTSGDRFLDASLAAIGGKGVFVKEIEDALIEKEIDIAVHSMKDLPTELAAGLVIAAVPEREDARDALVSADGRSLGSLPSGSVIGTGSLRRRAQILHYRPDLAVRPIRGNVDTRLKKLDQGEVNALVMAVAGLKRIGQESRIDEYLAPEICLGAVGQGALALETRAGDGAIGELAFLHDPVAAHEVAAERAFLRRLGGGCLVPVGARAQFDGGRVRLTGVVADPDGGKLLRDEIAGDAAAGERLGEQLAIRLLDMGAAEILLQQRGSSAHGAS